jgi:hypothetical protein
MTTNFFSPSLFCCCFWIRDPRSGIRDPGWVKIRIQDPDKHPGSATLDLSHCWPRWCEGGWPPAACNFLMVRYDSSELDHEQLGGGGLEDLLALFNWFGLVQVHVSLSSREAEVES